MMGKFKMQAARTAEPRAETDGSTYGGSMRHSLSLRVVVNQAVFAGEMSCFALVSEVKPRRVAASSQRTPRKPA